MKKIMVVDNEPDIVDLTRTVLELGGYTVAAAYSGEECLRKLEKEKFDLVLLDIMMPDINGYEVCKKIKSNPETKSTKIIVLSGYLDEESFREMKEYGADLCFSKPLPLNRLKKEVASLLGLSA